VDEVIEGEGVAELKGCHGRRYGLFDIHGVAPLGGKRYRYRRAVARYLSVLRHWCHFLIQELGDGFECFR
jgi:hypothetical protein